MRKTTDTNKNMIFQKINALKRIIPTISGVMFGIFIWDLQTNRSLTSFVWFALLGGILFNLMWISYSKIILKHKQKAFEKDTLTFTPFFLLALFPIKNLISLDSRYIHPNIISLILFGLSISVFIFLKLFFYEKSIQDFKNDKLIYVLMVVYFIIFSILTILKHETFYSTAYDLAIYDQAIWGFKNLKFTDSIVGVPIIGANFQPILFFLTPFYFIYSNPITLLILQTIMVALGALPIYLLTKKVLGNRLVAFCLSLVYLLYPSIQFVNLFDFHPILLTVPFILFSLYFLERKNYRISVISIILAGMSQENVPLILLPFGIFLYLKHRKKLLGAIISLLGLTWFIINFKILIPYFLGSTSLSIGATTYFGSTFSEIIKTIITRPIYTLRYVLTLNKAIFLFLLFMPISLGIFALLSPEFLLLGITEFGILLLHTPNSIPEIVYQHQSSVIPFIIVATIYGIKKVSKFIENYKNTLKKNLLPAAGILLFSTALFANISYGPFTILYDLKDFNPYTDYTRIGHKFVSMIPKDASVAAPNWVLPHLSQREKAYMLYHLLRKHRSRFESGELEYPNYILIDLSDALIDPKRSALKIHNSDLNNLFTNEKYGITASEGTWVLLKKGENHDQNICKIQPYLNNDKYPYLKLNLSREESLEKC